MCHHFNFIIITPASYLPLNTSFNFLILNVIVNFISFQAFFRWVYWFNNIGALLALTFVAYLQQNVSFFYGNLVPACSLTLALIIFLGGKRAYARRPPAGTVDSNILNIVKEAIKRSRRPSLSCLFVDHWLNRAKLCFGGSYSSWEVEDVKKFCRLLPIFGLSILYYTVYAQVSLEDQLKWAKNYIF